MNQNVVLLLRLLLRIRIMAAQIARRLIILGAPGSGKSTIAKRIVQTYGLPYVTIGDIFRQQIQQKSGNRKYNLLQMIYYYYFRFHLRG